MRILNFLLYGVVNPRTSVDAPADLNVAFRLFPYPPCILLITQAKQ